MKITERWEKPVAALGIGLLNLGTKYLDEKQGWKEPIKNSTDIVRLVAFGSSLLLNYADIETEVTEAIFYASAPLVVETLYNVIKSYAPRTFKKTYSSPPPVIVYSPPTTSTTETKSSISLSSLTM